MEVGDSKTGGDPADSQQQHSVTGAGQQKAQVQAREEVQAREKGQATEAMAGAVL